MPGRLCIPGTLDLSLADFKREENKDWEGEDLSSKLTQISSEGPFLSLPDLLYKTYRFLQILGFNWE